MAIVGDCHADHVMFGIEDRLSGFAAESIRYTGILAVNFHPQLRPPGTITAFVRAKVDPERVDCSFAGKLHSQELATLICHGLSVILIERTLAITARIDSEREWSGWNLIRALSQRLHGQDGPFPYKNRQNLKRGMYLRLHRCGWRSSSLMQPLAAPIVVPVNRRKFNRIRIRLFRERRRRNEQIGAE